MKQYYLRNRRRHRGEEMKMTKKRVSELEGAQLDWAVAMAGEEWKTAHRYYPTMTLDPTFAAVRIGEFGYLDGRSVCILIPNNPMRQGPQEFSPSKLWEHGGPIIERERIDIEWWRDSSDLSFRWDAVIHVINTQRVRLDGPSPLIAAMRAFVASKLGDEVEVPSTDTECRKDE